MRHVVPRSTFLRTVAAVATGALAPGVAGAQAGPVLLRVIYFPGVSNWPVYVANAKGFFARENVALALTATPGSVYQFQHLSAGDFDIALTGMDNVIAYDEGQGQVPLDKPADFAAFMGGDNAFLRLYVRPGITSYADLKGKTLQVDALTTGYAFALRRMLEANGLREGDYKLESTGGTLTRYQKIIADDTYAGTLLTPPFDLQAAAKGLHNLGNAVDVVGPYAGPLGAASRGWMAQNGDVLVRYIRGYLAGLAWLQDPANKAEAARILADAAAVPLDIAATLYAVVTDPKTGMTPKGAIDIAGIRTLLTLRSAYGRPQKQLSDPFKYIDDRYYRRAIGA